MINLVFVLRKGECMYSQKPVFKYGTDIITVGMMLNYISDAEEKIKKYFPEYKSALNVLRVLKLIFDNKNPPKISKEEVKILIDVIEEIENMDAQDDCEKANNKIIALAFKTVAEMLL